MKVFIDTEFIEGTQKKLFGKTKPTIDLISIGLVDENGKEFYAISKEFNLKEAWNRHDRKVNKQFPHGPEYIKEYWIRQNVLLPIFNDLIERELASWTKVAQITGSCNTTVYKFTYRDFKKLLNRYGEKNAVIANGICAYLYGDDCGGSGESAIELAMKYEISDNKLIPEFYGYFSAYDFVVFCWIFGTMMTLPKGFPKHCRDLKQMLDEAAEKKDWYYGRDIWSNTRKEGDTELQKNDRPATLDERLGKIKEYSNYPKKLNAHNSLSDAWWNFKLYKFLEKL